MNILSSFGSLSRRGQTNVNSITYINRLAIPITVDFSGSAFTDLSNAAQYAVTASGLNPSNINNSTFARLKYNGTGSYLKTADFSSTGSFTIHMKHAARFSTLSPFNFQYPNVISLSPTGAVNVGSSLTVTYYSTLNPGTIVLYGITGCTSADLSGAALTGTFMSPYAQIIYTIRSGGGSTAVFNVSGGLSSTISIN